VTPERYQQIGSVFDAALEREPAARAAFLAEACGADEALRREVASLIASHEQDTHRIENSPDDVAAGWLAAAKSIPRHEFAHFAMISLLGKGGMGEVWLAEDSQLGRKVAIKLLPTEFTTDADRLRRFEQEARAASALNHPNIITIHEIGKVDATLFIVTEYIEGETLRERMKDDAEQRVPETETLEVALQICAALTAAHHAGIVHRDIKPENVMVRRDGYAKVLDFGLAKLTEPLPGGISEPGVEHSTETGAVMGTPRYMSPEQARGEKVDARTDIWSLGVVVYEMIAGRPPFPGKTPGDVIAAILRDEPPPLNEYVPGASPELARVVTKAMRKERAERYQTAQDLLADLKELKQAVTTRTRVGLTPSRSRRRFLLLAVALLSLAVPAGWFYWSRKPAITARDTILLADFDNRTGDDIFDGTLKQGLAIQLQQSPFLNLFPEARIRQTLGMMGRSPNERVTAEIAREICERRNIKALIAGSIAPLGSHYVITLEAINGQNGEVLAREQTEAESREQVLRALSQTATRLRVELGESLSSIQRFDKPFVEGTTSKLEAFKAWSLGIENSVSGKIIEAIPFYRRAVEIDPDFAQANSVLSIVYWGTGQPGLAAEYAEKAYRLRERVGEYENLRLTSSYHAFATGDLNKRIEVLQLLRRGYPLDPSGPIDLAHTYLQIGQSEPAVAEGREAVRLNPTFAPAYWPLALALLRLNRFTEARNAIAQALQLNLGLINLHSMLYQIVFIESAGGDKEGLQKQIDWARGKPDEYIAVDLQTGTTAFAGQSRKSRELALRAIDMATRGGMKEVAARYAAELATRNAVLGNCLQARSDTALALTLERGRASLPNSALALALCGEAHQVKSFVDELTKCCPQNTVINSLWVPMIRAAGELKRGNATQAVQQLQSVSPYETAAQFWPQYLRGISYLKLRRGAEATGEFQKILDHRGEAPLSILYPLAYIGKARAAALSGDLTTSRKAYQDFITLWKDADADLSVLIEAKKEYERVR